MTGTEKTQGGELTERDFAAVIFDMDGTLIDSTPAVVRSWTIWAGELGIPLERLEEFHGVPAESTVAELLPPQLRKAALDRINELELTDLDGVRPLPGATESFRMLPADRIAIATSCTAPLAAARLKVSGLEPPAVLVTVDDVARGKPAPDPYLKAAALLGQPATDCLVVEDAVKGLRSARDAGCATLAVVTTSPRDALTADLVVDNLSRVLWVTDPATGRIRVQPN
ncbi:HAD family phosphatase [Microlunatus sp. Gsoil 973]|uniref:HAD family hydrolase n=1 Tax=Microlunatus sp. Gsoil 973 TaxID=2672569 RepID=UPI0012B4F709|nr:HAD-IA family hydrolase [Microlunatus sp. Gsoil 973]QGN34639.1 HAD-IA family hydrolase [Microlunatus sp. Gsoil 973]